MAERRNIARNRKAFKNYVIEDRYEAGLELRGSEVKSLRAGKANLTDAYVQEEGDELFLVNCHINPYPFANMLNHEPLRKRKLLMHRVEMDKIGRKLNERGFTAVPLNLYFKGARVKLEFGLAKGKRQSDKRAEIRARDEQRDLEREFKNRQ